MPSHICFPSKPQHCSLKTPPTSSLTDTTAAYPHLDKYILL